MFFTVYAILQDAARLGRLLLRYLQANNVPTTATESPTFFLASFESTFTFGDALAAQQGKRHQESPLQLHGMVRIGRDLASRGANVLAYSRRGVRHRDAA